MKRALWLLTGTAILVIARPAQSITIGQGPAIGTDKRGTVWYQEFQDWTSNDVRVVSSNNDEYVLNDGFDTSRDLIAFYSHDGGATGSGGDGNYYFRTDFFDLAYQAELGNLDVYVLISCASGGTTTLPDGVQGTSDRSWNVALAMYDTNHGQIYNSSLVGQGTNSFVSSQNGGISYWRSDLDSMEFGVSRQVLINAGWNGSSPIQFQVFTAKDFNNTLIDTVNSFNRTTKVLTGAVASTNSIRTAKYAAIVHANQSYGTRSQTQYHIYSGNWVAQNLYPGFVRTLDSHTMLNVPLNMHISGSLLSSFLWARSSDPNVDGPTFLNRCKQFIQNGTGSLIGGVFAEHIMPYYEGQVNQRSIAAFNDLAQSIFNLSTNDMKVMHVPERVIHSNTNWPHANPNGPLKGLPFEDIKAGGYQATYLDEISHLHWWFYSDETNYFNACGCGEKWAGFGGCNDRQYQHKLHKINGVLTFLINDREDQEKFGPEDGGMAKDTRYTLLDKAIQANDPGNPGGYAQITLVFDDWEAYAGNCFTCTTPNNNADQWHQTIRWAANHQWIQVVNLKDVVTWAQSDTNWVYEDHGNVYNKNIQTYEWLKRASQQDYDHWYYGQNSLEENFFARIPATANNSTYFIPGTKSYGDLNTPGTLMRDSWDKVAAMPQGNLRRLTEWQYSAMIYETAWHDEAAPPWWNPNVNGDWSTTYKSRNYQWNFDVNDGCAVSYSDQWYNNTSGWATRLHGHVRSVGILADAAQWAQDVKNNVQGPATVAVTKDVDDDLWNEFILKNNRVYLCFKRWGGRLVAAFVYDPVAQDATEVVGQPVANPAQESDEEDADNTRCSAFKDRWAGGLASNNTQYVDMDYAASSPVQGSNFWEFVSADGKIRKRLTLGNGRDAVRGDYTLGANMGTLYVRHGLGPNQLDILRNGDSNLITNYDNTYYGLSNADGGAAYAVNDVNCLRSTGGLPNAGYQNREFPGVEQVEQYNTATNFTMWLAFSPASAVSVDGDGVPNWWRLQYFGHITGVAADGSRASDDPDGDGMSNLQEYLAGTTPTSANSVLRVISIARQSDTNVQITWSSVAGKNYEVSATTNLSSAAFSPLVASTNAAGSAMSYTDTAATGTKYYRVRVVP